MADDVTGSANSGQPSDSNVGDAIKSGTGTYTPAPMIIPEAYKGEKSLQSFKTHDDFVKSHLELNKKLGSAVWLPGEKDDEASKADKYAKLYKALGKPDSLDGYDLSKQSDGALDAANLNQLRSWAHANNLNQAQFDAAADYLNSLYHMSQEAVRNETHAHEEQMRKEWGEPLFKQRAGLAHSAINKLGGQELAQLFAERGLGSHPKLVELFAQIGSKMLEDNAFTAGEAPGAMSKSEAQRKINEVMNNKDDIYHRKHAGKAGHRERVDEVSGWFSILHS